eukprot:s1381_g36.t1
MTSPMMLIAMQDLMQVALVVACVFAGWSLQTSACSFLLQRVTYPLNKTVECTELDTETMSAVMTARRSSSKTMTFLKGSRSWSSTVPLVLHQVLGRAGWPRRHGHKELEGLLKASPTSWSQRGAKTRFCTPTSILSSAAPGSSTLRTENSRPYFCVFRTRAFCDQNRYHSIRPLRHKGRAEGTHPILIIVFFGCFLASVFQPCRPWQDRSWSGFAGLISKVEDVPTRAGRDRPMMYRCGLQKE